MPRNVTPFYFLFHQLLIYTLPIVTPQMGAFASLWNYKTRCGPRLISTSKAPHLSLGTITNISPPRTQILFRSRTLLYKPARVFREGRGWQDFGGSCFPSAKRRLTANARGGCSSHFLPIPDCSRAAWRGSRTSFPGGASALLLGSPTPWVGAGAGKEGARVRAPARRLSAAGRAGRGVPGAAGHTELRRGGWAGENSLAEPRAPTTGMHLNPPRGWPPAALGAHECPPRPWALRTPRPPWAERPGLRALAWRWGSPLCSRG